MIHFIRSGQSAHPTLKGSGKVLTVTIGDGLPATTRECCINTCVQGDNYLGTRHTHMGGGHFKDFCLGIPRIETLSISCKS